MKHTDWTAADEGMVHKSLCAYVAEVERAQISLFDRFEKLAALYDPGEAGALDGKGMQSLVSENLIASNVDTVYAVIASSEVRARFMTDDGDWSTQRRARHLEWYADGLCKQLDVDQICREAFKDGALKGTGVIKVSIDEWDQIRVERVLIDDIIVDQGAARGGKPRQMQHRMIVGADVLKGKFPGDDVAQAVDAALKGTASLNASRQWADYRPVNRDDVVCIESWSLPVGKRGTKGYQPGRHAIVIEGLDLLDEEWHEESFPFAIFRWSRRDKGFYGIGLAERIAGHQRAINKLNWQIDRQLDQHAVPTTYVRLADANLAVKSTNRAGTIVPIKGEMPVTVIPPAVSGETYRRQETIKASSFEESGVSRMAAQSMKPGGLDSGAALREYRDASTQRFAPQEKDFERLKLDVVMLVVGACKQLGDDAPEVMRKSKHGPRAIKWADVDLGEVRVQIAAASNMSKTPAGRVQFAMELAQAGIISKDGAIRLLQHPDAEAELSLYTAARECIEADIESMLDGNVEVPDPYLNLKMIGWLGQAHVNKAKQNGAPEEVLESLRQYTVQAAWMLSQAAGPMGPDPAMVDPMAAAAGAGPMPGGAPPDALMGAGVAPVAAL